MSPSEGSKREDDAPPPPPRDRTTLWAVLGAVVVAAVVVAAVFMIEDEPQGDGAPTPSPKSRRPGRSPVEEFNRALRQMKRKEKDLETAMGAAGATVTAKTVKKIEAFLADLDELRGIAPRLRLTEEEHDLLVQWLRLRIEMTRAGRDVMTQAAASGETMEQAIQRVQLALRKWMPEIMKLEPHPAVRTLRKSLEEIGVEVELAEGFLLTPPDESEPPVTFDAEIIVE